ncbi:MAG: CDP-diacylglycerol--glycerol-3-phosphate 3-phosphatidyltransferase [Bdellovibrionota bacterium]
MEKPENFAHEHDGELSFTNAPNILTLIRILFVPVVVYMLFKRDPAWDIAAGICFGVASITDYFDGYLARQQKLVTVYGKLMDPLADKFLVVSALIMLQEIERIHPVVVILLICREIAVTGLRALASAEGVVIEASSSAKWKTALQMFAIGFMMVNPGVFGIPLFKVGNVLLYISLAISLWSAKSYIVDFFVGFAEKRKQAKLRRLAAKHEAT